VIFLVPLVFSLMTPCESADARDDTADIHTAADLSNSYKQLRDNSPNMHQNADSYRVFAALCSRSLYKRALLQEDPVRELFCSA